MRRPVIATTALLLLAPLTISAAPADAGPAGSWTTITGAAADIGNISVPDGYRTPDGVLHVVYTVDDTPSSVSLRHVAIGDDGSVLLSSIVVQGWATLTEDPVIVPTATGGLRIVFSGIRSTGSGETYTGAMASAVSTDGGATWSLDPYVRSQSGYAYASSGTGAALAADGSTYSAFAGGATVRYSDAEIATPTVGAQDPQFTVTRTQDGATVGDCCTYDVDVVAVPGTDQIWMSWYGNGTAYDNRGYFVRQIAPTLGPITRAPKSLTRDDSNADGTISPGEGEAGELGGGPHLVATADGVYFAYQIGYPFAGFGIWRIGSDKPVVAPVDDVLDMAIAPDSEGRIWAVWYDDDVRRVFASRTNPAVTRFGQPVDLGAPHLNGESSVWSTLINARPSGDQADVVVNTTGQLMHQEVLAGLTLSAKPGTFVRGDTTRVVFAVTDAGVAVPGASVKADGRSCTTAANGRCTIIVKAGAKDRRLTATATKSGFTRDGLTLRGRS